LNACFYLFGMAAALPRAELFDSLAGQGKRQVFQHPLFSGSETVAQPARFIREFEGSGKFVLHQYWRRDTFPGVAAVIGNMD